MIKITDIKRIKNGEQQDLNHYGLNFIQGELKVGQVAYFSVGKFNFSGLRTSTVQDIQKSDNTYVITTLNSIYVVEVEQ